MIKCLVGINICSQHTVRSEVSRKMSRYILILFLMACAIENGQVSAQIPIPGFSEIMGILKFCREVASRIKKGYDLYEKHVEHKQDIMEMVMAEISDVPEKLDQMESRLSNKMDTMVQTLLSRLPLIGKLDASMRELHNYVVRVDGMYDNYVYYSKNTSNFNDYTIKRFVSSVTSEDLGNLQDILNKIHRLVLPKRTSHIQESLLLLISKQTAASYLELCDDSSSPAQRLYELYATIALTEIRGYAMTSFVYGILPRYENVTFTAELDKAEAKLAIRCKGYLEAIQQAMLNSPRDIRRCDPKHHKRNETFFEFEELFQAYIVNEPDVELNVCRRTCPTLTSKRVVMCYNDEFCPHNRICEGSVTDCEYGGGKMEVCETPNSSRRYQWFKDNNGVVYGDNSEGCLGEIKYPEGWLRWFVRCDYCICTCSTSDPNSRALRTISFMSQTSDIANNMVVTGLKFQMKSKMIQIQIKVGKLLPEGRISNTTDEWKPLDDIRWNVHNESGVNLYKNHDGKEEILERMKDYDHVTRFHNIIYLDDIILPEGYLVTGVRLAHDKKPTENGNYKPFILEVQATPFDIIAGRLTHSKSNPPIWINARSMNSLSGVHDSPRTELKLQRPDNPTKSNLNLLDSRHNEFIYFRASDLRKDAGQSTIPFFDGQSIETKPAVPLAGIALSHKGANGFGGFLTFRIFTVDMAKQIKFDIPSNTMMAYWRTYVQSMKDGELSDYEYLSEIIEEE